MNDTSCTFSLCYVPVGYRPSSSVITEYTESAPSVTTTARIQADHTNCGCSTSAQVSTLYDPNPYSIQGTRPPYLLPDSHGSHHGPQGTANSAPWSCGSAPNKRTWPMPVSVRSSQHLASLELPVSGTLVSRLSTTGDALLLCSLVFLDGLWRLLLSSHSENLAGHISESRSRTINIVASHPNDDKAFQDVSV